jgi:hypothetical protein
MSKKSSRIAAVLVAGLTLAGISDGAVGLGTALAAPARPVVESAAEGYKPFIGDITVSGVPQSTTTFSFRIEPKPGTFSEPVTAVFTRQYLSLNGYFSDSTTVTIPLFGLYDDYDNTVTISLKSARGRATTLSHELTTSEWSSSCRNTLAGATKVVSPSTSVKLDYSFFMLKAWACDAHPIVMDIDGNIRWAGTIGGAQQGSTFFHNNFYVGNGSALYEITPFGDSHSVGNYSADGYATFHHNIDPGRRGMLLEFNKSPDVESDVIEVDANGEVLETWDVAEIVRKAMIKGGDDPSAFVRQGDDWFHNNAATYWKQKNQIVLSGREDFVIGIGYDDDKIKWILGDPDKAWYTYPSLRAFALDYPEGTDPPIGEHAVSFTSAGSLMLFNNGYASFAHSPSGNSRSTSFPQQFSLNLRNHTAKEVWRFDHSPALWSPICSSIYQHGTSYLVDYASEGGGIRLVGLDKHKNIGFELKINGSGYDWGWNAYPFDFAGMSFDKP